MFNVCYLAGPSKVDKPDASSSKPPSLKAAKTTPHQLLKSKAKVVVADAEDPMDQDEPDSAVSSSPEDDLDEGEEEIDPDEELEDEDGVASQK